jgi:hypothetical protein
MIEHGTAPVFDPSFMLFMLTSCLHALWDVDDLETLDTYKGKVRVIRPSSPRKTEPARLGASAS